MSSNSFLSNWSHSELKLGICIEWNKVENVNAKRTGMAHFVINMIWVACAAAKSQLLPINNKTSKIDKNTSTDKWQQTSSDAMLRNIEIVSKLKMKNFIQIVINDVYKPLTRSSERNLDVICYVNNECFSSLFLWRIVKTWAMNSRAKWIWMLVWKVSFISAKNTHSAV